MTEFGAVFAMVAALSLTCTKIVDFFRNVLDKSNTYPKYVWNVLALVVGLAFALGWQVNIAGALVALVPALAPHADKVAGTSGEILTGFIIGTGAGFFHEFLDALSGVATRLHD